MRLHATLVRSGTLAGLGLISWVAAEYLRVRLEARRGTRWVARDLNAVDRAARRALRWQHSRPPDVASDVMAFMVAPAVCGWALKEPGEPLRPMLARDALPVTESAVVTGLANQFAKHIAMRERPFAHGRSRRAVLADRYGSFFSGHASSVAVICAATATRRLRRGPWTWKLLALPALPMLVAYLRVASDQHYATDVLAGLGVGAAIGALYGLYSEPGLSPSPSPMGEGSVAQSIPIAPLSHGRKALRRRRGVGGEAQ